MVMASVPVGPPRRRPSSVSLASASTFSSTSTSTASSTTLAAPSTKSISNPSASPPSSILTTTSTPRPTPTSTTISSSSSSSSSTSTSTPSLASATNPPSSSFSAAAASSTPSRPLDGSAPSLLQPRVAVVLKVPPRWHPWLFFFRLISILPASWWGLPSLLRLLLHFLPGPPDQFLLVPPGLSVCQAGLETAAAAAAAAAVAGATTTATTTSSSCAAFQPGGPAGAVVAAPYALTETFLATIWCFACGYLSFFFTDCLMSRWLINYTPQATIVRLLSINAVNAYLTLSVLSTLGGFDDPRLLLPGWVAIATTLTVCYHITHQKINIRKETSTSVNVFSIASYITMVVLLLHMQAYEANYPPMPLVTKGKHVWLRAVDIAARVKLFINEHADARGEL